MSETTFTFQLEQTLMEQFAAATKRANRNVEEVLCDLIRDYVEYETPAYDEWFRRKVQAGIDSANAGHVLSAEDVEAEFSLKRAELRRRHGL